MRYCFALIWIVLVACSSIKSIVDFESFSKQLEKEQKRRKCSFYPDMAYAAREQLKGKFDFIDYKLDTIYVLESINPESGSLYQSVWTNQGKLEYKIQGGDVEIVRSPFIKRLYPMIEQWDISGIRAEEKTHGQLLDGSQMIGTRIVLNNGKFIIECFKFKEFFDMKKDQ